MFSGAGWDDSWAGGGSYLGCEIGWPVGIGGSDGAEGDVGDLGADGSVHGVDEGVGDDGVADVGGVDAVECEEAAFYWSHVAGPMLYPGFDPRDMLATLPL